MRPSIALCVTRKIVCAEIANLFSSVRRFGVAYRDGMADMFASPTWYGNETVVPTAGHRKAANVVSVMVAFGVVAFYGILLSHTNGAADVAVSFAVATMLSMLWMALLMMLGWLVTRATDALGGRWEALSERIRTVAAQCEAERAGAAK